MYLLIINAQHKLPLFSHSQPTPLQPMSSEFDPMIKTLGRRRHPATTLRWPSHHKISFRRRKLPRIRLGGKRARGGFLLMRVFRRVKMRWLKLKHSRMLKKLIKYYLNMMKDVVIGSGTIKSFQQKLLSETSFAIPVLGLSFNSYPNKFWGYFYLISIFTAEKM